MCVQTSHRLTDYPLEGYNSKIQRTWGQFEQLVAPLPEYFPGWHGPEQNSVLCWIELPKYPALQGVHDDAPAGKSRYEAPVNESQL